MFSDIWDFSQTSEGRAEGKGSYFLGCIVSYENDETHEIIDGQQRLTSLFLLLRALYEKILSMKKGDIDTTETLKRDIQKLLWEVDPLSHKVSDMRKVLLKSDVISDEKEEIFISIMETGKADFKARDHYSRNYRCFQEKLSECAETNPFNFYTFVRALLDKVVILPISANSQDTAMTIFSTLNNRGLPLSDADIFKAKMFQESKNREEFANVWKDLEERAENIKESMQTLFTYNMFYLRALSNESSTSMKGIRAFYLDNQSQNLLRKDTLLNLEKILNFWEQIDYGKKASEEWAKDTNIEKDIDILRWYPNEYWKYSLIIYYLCHKKNPDFKLKFSRFIRKFSVEITTKYLVSSTLNAIKGSVHKLHVAITKDIHPDFPSFGTIEEQELKAKIIKPHPNIEKVLLRLLAYDMQEELLPKKVDIEHIFPKKWNETYFPEKNPAEISELIEHLGNKILLEKKLNIKANNNYFKTKKEEYKQSFIAMAKQLGNEPDDDWSTNNIMQRDGVVYDRIKQIFDRWRNEY